MIGLLLLLIVAWADEDQLLRIAISDTEYKRLQRPIVVVNGVSVPLFDDGSLSGDVKEDAIWVASTFVPLGKNVMIQLRDANGIIGEVPLELPQNETHTVQLKTTKNGVVVDYNAPKMPWNGGGILSLGAEALTGVPSPGDGKVRLRVLFNDQPMKSMINPILTLGDKDISFVDDGNDPSDTALDNIWIGWIDVPRQEKIQFQLSDGEVGLEFVNVSLPATPAASVMVYRLPSGLSRFVTQMRAVEKSVVQATALLGAAPRMKGGAPMIMLSVVVDMRGVSDVEQPTIRYQEETFSLSDDGSMSGDDAGDSIYVASLNVEQSNTIDLSLYNGEEALGAATVFLPESGRAMVKLQLNNGVNAWLDQGMSDLPMVTFATPKKGAVPLRSKDLDQGVSIFIEGSIPQESSIRISGKESVLGIFPISQTQRHIEAQIPIQSRVRIAILEDNQEKDVFWLVLSNALQSLVSIEYKQEQISFVDSFIVDGETYSQDTPLVVQALPKSDDPFSGKTLLSVRLSDPLQELEQPEIVGFERFERDNSGMFTSSLLLDYEEFIVLNVKDGTRDLSSMIVFLPQSANAGLGLVHSRVGIQASETSTGVTEEPLIFEAAKEGKQELTDKIQVQLLIDDRVLQRLRTPKIRLAEEGREAILLRDDGEDADTQAKDQVYTASFLVGRAEYLQIAVEDRGKPFGEMTVFLPSSSEAKIRLRTVDAKNGLKLLTEAQALSEVDSPDLDESTQQGGSSEKRLVHILWVSIILFSLFFAYVRSVIFRTWKEDIRPILTRLEKMLDEREK
ncbi:MAG: hypothetical protein CL916_03280 [Deltaproteobacteria bacterium]|nr:hypothetical protein [Deltaproteobacteria bacterium]